MEEENLKCVMCQKDIENDDYFTVRFEELCEDVCLCRHCLMDAYAYITGWNIKL